jgi:hypothetical protein
VESPKASPQQRHQKAGRIVLTEIKAWTITTNFYTHPAKDIREASGHCLNAIASAAASGTASRLVIEREEAHDEHDRRLLTELMKLKDRPVRWDLLPPTAEPLLWAADAVAWCWGNPQPKWSSLVKPFIQNVHRL